MTKFRWIVLGLVIGFNGCAVNKPIMGDNEYSQLTKFWYVVDYCTQQGWIDPDTAARGKRYITANVYRYSFDSDRFNREVYSLSQNTIKPSEQDCRKGAMLIHERKQNIELANQNASEQQQAIQNIINNRPVQTYCNKIGNQVLCNSY